MKPSDEAHYRNAVLPVVLKDVPALEQRVDVLESEAEAHKAEVQAMRMEMAWLRERVIKAERRDAGLVQVMEGLWKQNEAMLQGMESLEDKVKSIFEAAPFSSELDLQKFASVHTVLKFEKELNASIKKAMAVGEEAMAKASTTASEVTAFGRELSASIAKKSKSHKTKDKG